MVEHSVVGHFRHGDTTFPCLPLQHTVATVRLYPLAIIVNLLLCLIYKLNFTTDKHVLYRGKYTKVENLFLKIFETWSGSDFGVFQTWNICKDLKMSETLNIMSVLEKVLLSSEHSRAGFFT